MNFIKRKIKRISQRLQRLFISKSGDQLTGWLIVVLLVVVVGAAFMTLYQSSITTLWEGIINKAKNVFGI